MNIFFVNRSFGIRIGGGELFDYYVAKELKKLGHDVKFIVGKKYGNKFNKLDEFETIYITTPYLRDLHYKYSKSYSRILRKLAAIFLDLDLYLFERKVFKYLSKNLKYKPDIIELCGLPRLGSWIEKKLGIPTVIEWHGEPSKESIKFAKKCSGHIAIGAAYPKVRNLVSYQTIKCDIGVDYNEFSRKEGYKIRLKHGIPENAIVLIFVGRLIPVKNLKFMIDGFSEALKENSKLYLLIAGEGPEKNFLIDYVNKKSIVNNVIFLGFVNRTELPYYYSAADVFIITSNYESFSLVTLEAMSCELPIIATNVGYLPEIVKNGENGLIVENNNIFELKKAILKLASSVDLREKIGKNNRLKVIQQYNWKKVAENLIDLYSRHISVKS